MFAGKSSILEELLKKHSLDEDDIKQLFDHCDRYIIPYQQIHVKRFGLVLYNTKNRDGAEAEAEIMNDRLAEAGFATRMKEWTYSYQLFGEISETAIEEIVSNGLSLLVISIMSHGTAGMLRDSGGSAIAITEVLSHLKSKLPEKLPLVRHKIPCKIDRSTISYF